MPSPPARPRTDPADLLSLAGRFMGTLVLTVLALFNLFARHYGTALFLGIASLVLQAATVKLWRRLREERARTDAAHEIAP